MNEVVEVNEAVLAKEERLRELIRGYDSLAVAYSGGVDSTYLAAVAHDVLGNRVHLIMADSPSVPRSEFVEATTLAAERGWRLDVIATDEFRNEAYLRNDGNRCYLCRSELFIRMRRHAAEDEIAVLAYGANMDDQLDATRVGAKAASDHRVVSPLQDAQLGKAEIRALSKRRGLPTWNKPSFACLSSRFPTGTRVDLDVLAKIEQGEALLKQMGFHQYRLRHHGSLCRIEVEPTDFEKLLDPEVRRQIVAALRGFGYTHVTLDLAGYRSGSTATL